MTSYLMLNRRLFYLLLFTSIFEVSGCKKHANEESPKNSSFSFTYKGNRHVLPLQEGVTEWSVNPGLYIYLPDLFNGTIYFPRPGCAYLDPATDGTASVRVVSSTTCELQQNGGPIDSIAVYIFQSGMYNINWENCNQHQEYDPFTGQTVTYDVCDANGTFNLTLKNKNGETIEISDGQFRVYSMRR